MLHFRFTESIQSIPRTHDAKIAKRARDEWLVTAGEELTKSGVPTIDIVRSAFNDPIIGALLNCIFANSPYLATLANRDPTFVCNLLLEGPDTTISSIFADLKHKKKESLNGNEISHFLRIAKQRTALTVALADIAGIWALKKVTNNLSNFACLALDVAAAHLIRHYAQRGAFELHNLDDPLHNCGLVIIGMGKLGASELNYSSDIDLIILYDTEIIETLSPELLQANFIRLTRDLITLMHERTPYGYVFRTDLRLRPDPGATPVAISVIAAETYYESLGQNWERAAMIKARAVAGDIEAGNKFLQHLTPFVWRKNLDFAAIHDIHSIKRQINPHSGGTEIDGPGHNIKLGQGGIREIEFFAQTQQLIWGGRVPNLRSPATVQTLSDLAIFGKSQKKTASELIDSYKFLRRVEHRLQMINDEQTHTLPKAPENYRHLALFLGYTSSKAFSKDLLYHLDLVRHHYDQLFPDAPSLSTKGSGNLIFTSSDTDLETLEKIANMGFKNPKTIDKLVRAWHHGRYRATHSARARETLTDLIPRLLKAIASTSYPDEALFHFDTFLKGLPAGIQLFSMFQAQPKVLDLIAEIIGIAPRLARHISAHPSVLESVLTVEFFNGLPDQASMCDELNTALECADHFEAKLDTSRRWAHGRRFQLGVLRLQDRLQAYEASQVLSDIAETVLQCLYPAVAEEFAKKYSAIYGSEMAVIAFGKLGSREMSASSDLDLVFIYDTPPHLEYSKINKKLPPMQYYARLCQRLVNAITTPTAEGSLYEVDMRLRPSGNMGPVATNIEAFRNYYVNQAWVWEHMALTRARVVYATSKKFAGAVSVEIATVLTQSRKPDLLLRDVADMRQRLAFEKSTENFWSLKHFRGGTIDIEFIVQYLILRHASEHPEILAQSTIKALDNLVRTSLLDSRVGSRLSAALTQWHRLQGFLSLTMEDDINSEKGVIIPEALKAHLARVGGKDNFAKLEKSICDLAAEVHGFFKEIVEHPAADLPLADKDKQTPPDPSVLLTPNDDLYE